MGDVFPDLMLIADCGSNIFRYDEENRNLECAALHIRQAAACGVTHVKFQMFTNYELYGDVYSSETKETPYALPAKWLPILKAQCDEHKVGFMCTAFSPEGVRAVDPYVKVHKIASAEFLHRGILDAVIETGKPFIMSTGGCSEEEINETVGYILKKNAFERYALLECVASYPAASSDYNLSVLDGWVGGAAVGVSDHTTNNIVALTAVGCGATIFEKHFTEDSHGYQVETPDTPHSIGIGPLHYYCKAIRTAFAALGDGIKKPVASEADFMKIRRPKGKNTFRGRV